MKSTSYNIITSFISNFYATNKKGVGEWVKNDCDTIHSLTILHRNLPHPNIIFIDGQESINAERIPITMSICVCSYHKEKEKKVSFDKNDSHLYNEKDTLLQQWRKKVSFFSSCI